MTRDQLRGLILGTLFDTAGCPDSTEHGRACRYCETTALVDVLVARGVVEVTARSVSDQ